jgi:Na+-driven multidrug efflux pump
LVGQELGAGDNQSALSYGWDATRLSLFVHIITAAIVFVVARPIGSVFVNEPSNLDQIVPLIRVATIGVVGLSLDSVMTGIFRGSGDTQWPFYAKFAGLYFFTLPIVYIGTVTPLGINGLYLGLFAETTVSGVLLFARFLIWGGGFDA